MAAVPLDVWFLVFDLVSDNDTLWSVLRNVSQHLRVCVDAYFERYVLRDTVIDLIYTTIHTYDGPSFHQLLHLPVRFDRLSDDGTRAVYRRVHSRYPDDRPIWGSIRGWVPFIERYCRETDTPLRKVTHKEMGVRGPPAWEKELKTLFKHPKFARSTAPDWLLRDHTTIGRGDRPPYLIRIPNPSHDPSVHDTALHSLEIDCQARELSFLWRDTLSAFYTSQRFVSLAQRKSLLAKFTLYDPHLDAAARDVLLARFNGHVNRYNNHWRRARRKRLVHWVAGNRHRMSNIHRLVTEDCVYRCMEHFKGHAFAPENLVEVEDEEMDSEIVPERCGGDCAALWYWPRTRKEKKEIEPVYIYEPEPPCRGCNVL